MRKKLIPAIAGLAALLVPLQSFAACKKKIAEVDERIADPDQLRYALVVLAAWSAVLLAIFLL